MDNLLELRRNVTATSESIEALEKEIVALKAIFQLSLTRSELEILKTIKDMPYYLLLNLRRNNTAHLNYISEDLYSASSDNISSEELSDLFVSNTFN